MDFALFIHSAQYMEYRYWALPRSFPLDHPKIKETKARRKNKIPKNIGIAVTIHVEVEYLSIPVHSVWRLDLIADNGFGNVSENSDSILDAISNNSSM